ncbi:hypothetical protein BRADI_1g09050v3 [Brachypodium distachyon]|uniref:Uncharacterized protein n=1 Tax=Brachypodium distachyon TaxID=15368 RepID=I1GNF8_BRADI|nr:hypothetical protein BRADI_1g09050v3 [Brachypodium distachyon]
MIIVQNRACACYCSDLFSIYTHHVTTSSSPCIDIKLAHACFFLKWSIVRQIEALYEELIFWSFAGAQQRQRRELPDEHIFGAYIALKALSIDGEILLKDKEHVARLLDTSVRTVERIWKLAHEHIAQGLPVDLSNQKKGKVGRKRADLGLSRIFYI